MSDKNAGTTSTKTLHLPVAPKGRKEEVAKDKFQKRQLAIVQNNAQSQARPFIQCGTTSMGCGSTRLKSDERAALIKVYFRKYGGVQVTTAPRRQRSAEKQ